METIRKIFNVIYVSSCIVLAAFAAAGGAYFTGYLPERVRVEEIEKIIHVPEVEPTMDEVLDDAPKHGMERVVAEVLLHNEDGGKWRKNAIRCEWQSKFWLQVATKLAPKDPAQRDAMRCSYGPFQVAGWHAPKYGMVWSDLLDTRNNLEVAAAVFGTCKQQAQNKFKGDTWGTYRDAFRCFNGSGPDAEAYANRSMARLSQIAVARMLEGES